MTKYICDYCGSPLDKKDRKNVTDRVKEVEYKGKRYEIKCVISIASTKVTDEDPDFHEHCIYKMASVMAEAILDGGEVK